MVTSKISKVQLTYIREVITPPRAMELLATMIPNRRVTQHRVNAYAKAIRNGQWHIHTGEPIRISEHGTLLDGQHRLWAVIEADCPLEATVVYGIPESAFPLVDQGRPRSTGEILGLQGEHTANVLGGAIRLLLAYERTEVLAKAGGSHTYLIGEVLQYLDEHPEVRESVRVGESVRRSLQGGAARWAGVHYILSAIDTEDTDYFLDGVTNGVGLAENSPIYQLRKRLLAEHQAIRKTPATEYTALIFKAWNAYRKGQPIVSLRWKGGGARPEPYPKPE